MPPGLQLPPTSLLSQNLPSPSLLSEKGPCWVSASQANNKFHLRKRGTHFSREQCLAYPKACSPNTRLSGMDGGSLTPFEKWSPCSLPIHLREQPGPEPQSPHPRGVRASRSLQHQSGTERLRPQSPAALRGPRRDVVLEGRRGAEPETAPPAVC